MSASAPDWLRALRAQAALPPLRPRVPLWAGAALIGSVEPDFLDKIGALGNIDGHRLLLKMEHPEQPGTVSGWHLAGDVTTGLNLLASRLRQAGLAGAWRAEQLAVCDVQGQHGQRVGTVERAAVRPLGIATQAVHLVGLTPDGRFWVQQRALDKPNDPGQWDTLMGGMVSSRDTVETALTRETWEEAGLTPEQLHNLTHGGVLSLRKPAPDGNGAGYVVERIDWYTCTVPEGVVPVNQDGEVAQFALMGAAQLLEAVQGGAFTLEASLILAAVMGHHVEAPTACVAQDHLQDHPQNLLQTGLQNHLHSGAGS